MSGAKNQETPPPKKISFWDRTTLPVASIVAIGLGHAYLFFGYVVDDAYISFRYAKNLVDSHGLAFNVGERVEGYTNFLWVLISSVALKLSQEPQWAMPILGMIAMAITLILVFVGSRRLISGPGHWARGLVAMMIVASSTGFAFYAVSGLETILFSLGITASAMAAISRRPLAFSILTGLSFLVRPEAALIGLLGTFALWHRSEGTGIQRLKRLVPCVIGFLIILTPYLAFKLSYFGSLIPNTARAKPPDFTNGLSYLAESCIPVAGFIALALVIFRKGKDSAPKWLIAFWFAYMVAIVFEGGDWMPAGRFFVTYLPLLALGVDEPVRKSLANLFGRWTLLRALTVASAVFYLGMCIHGTHDRYLKVQVTNIQSKRLHAVFYEMKKLNFKRIMAHDIGLLGYILSDVYIVDLGGLINRVVAESPGGFCTKEPPVDYLINSSPDVIVFVTWPPKQNPATGEMVVRPMFPVLTYVRATEWFQENFVPTKYYPVSDSCHLHLFGRKGPKER